MKDAVGLTKLKDESEAELQVLRYLIRCNRCLYRQTGNSFLRNLGCCWRKGWLFTLVMIGELPEDWNWWFLQLSIYRLRSVLKPW